MTTKMVNNMGKDKRTVRTFYETPVFLILWKYGFILKAINQFLLWYLEFFFFHRHQQPCCFPNCLWKILRHCQKKNGIVKLKLPLLFPCLLNNCILIRPYASLSETIVSSFLAKNASFLGYSSEERACTWIEKKGNGFLSWCCLHFWNSHKSIRLGTS